MPNRPSAIEDEPVVISLRTRQRYEPAGGAALPPPEELDRYGRSEEPDDFRHRMIVNVVAFLFVLLLIAAGVWLADTITTMRQTQDCVLTGKRGCGPVETSTSPGP